MDFERWRGRREEFAVDRIELENFALRGAGKSLTTRSRGKTETLEQPSSSSSLPFPDLASRTDLDDSNQDVR